MVIFCKVPYCDIARWCEDQGYVEVPISNYSPSNKPLLIVDGRILTNCHERVFGDHQTIQDYIEEVEDTKGVKVYFGLVKRAVSYIGDVSLAVWSKR